MRVAITSNGPGEFSGWVRPLVSALYERAPESDVTLFFVPDDYATGREPALAARLFPQARIVAADAYVRFAFGRRVAGVPERADVVQYLGGDLMHAARVRARLGGVACAYKFARKRDAAHIARAFALDERNAAELTGAGIASERIEVVGNLAIDGALGEAAGLYPRSPHETDLAPQSILFMPGTRRHEVANLVPQFFAAALRMRALRPDLHAAFAISPYTDVAELAAALAAGGHRNAWGARGRVVERADGTLELADLAGSVTFPVVRDAMRHASRAKLAVTLPGTKCIELAALGVATLVCVPLNAPEVVVINGPLQYLDRLPVVGRALKRAIVVGVDARFPFTAQPNIDTGEMLMPELRGTLMPGEIARKVAAYADDGATRAAASERLRALYAGHAGAAHRMARSLLACAAR
ncbi:MAG: hypothetical protein NVSMB19_07260 [Vulcanimicrobiaceae bacterium]